jgi:uncharacterized membrane protein
METNVGNPERWVSVVAGSALAAYGLTRRSIPGLVVAALGGAIAWRGATGRCPPALDRTWTRRNGCAVGRRDHQRDSERVDRMALRNAGSVHFTPANGQGTEVKVELRYDPPAGVIGAAIAKILGKDPARQVQEDLREFKELIETG